MTHHHEPGQEWCTSLCRAEKTPVPSTAITIDGDTAWLVVPLSGYHPNVATTYTHYNRPCDRCHGTGRMLEDDASRPTCPDCHGTGQHTFTIDVECVLPMCVNGKRGYWQDGHPCGYCNATGTYQLSVHVVDVLPIHGATEHWPDATHLSLDEGNRTVWLWTWTGQGFDFTQNYCTLPADAAPDKYAVRLAVAA
jgi:hypothetical protein